MFKQAQVTKRTTVDIDTRRSIIVIARARKPQEVAVVPHEAFIRNALKDKMGWPRKESAPETIKAAAREMAKALVQRDKDAATARALAREVEAAKELTRKAEAAKLAAENAAALDKKVADMIEGVQA